jgi:hypothetical protein
MTVRLNDNLANDLLDGIDAVFNSGVLEIRSGSQPSSANDAATGTLLATETVPADAFAAAASRSKGKNGTWQTTGEAGAGAGTNAGWFRLKNSGDTRRIDGSVTATGGGGQMELDNISIASGQTVTITAFNLTA